MVSRTPCRTGGAAPGSSAPLGPLCSAPAKHFSTHLAGLGTQPVGLGLATSPTWAPGETHLPKAHKARQDLILPHTHQCPSCTHHQPRGRSLPRLVAGWRPRPRGPLGRLACHPQHTRKAGVCDLVPFACNLAGLETQPAAPGGLAASPTWAPGEIYLPPMASVDATIQFKPAKVGGNGARKGRRLCKHGRHVVLGSAEERGRLGELWALQRLPCVWPLTG